MTETGMQTAAERRARERALSGIASAMTFGQPLEATLDALAAVVLECTGAEACGVIVRDRETAALRMAGGSGLPAGYIEAVEEAWRNGARTSSLDAMGSGAIVAVPNARTVMLDDPLYSPVHRFLRSVTWELVVVLPLMYRGEAVGALNVCYHAGAALDTEDRAFLSTIADQAAVAVQNVTLYKEAERRAKENEALSRIASSLTFDQPASVTFRHLAERVVAATDAIACAVILRDDELGVPQMAGTCGLPDEYAADMDATWRSGVPTTSVRAIETGEIQVWHNGRSSVAPGSDAVLRYWQTAPWDTAVVVPLKYRTLVLGALSCYYSGGSAPGAREIALLRAVADQAAVAAENARLFAQAQSAAVMEERQRLSRELHDSVSQALYGIALGARTARRVLDGEEPKKAVVPVDYVLQLAEAGLAEMRALIFELRPEALATEGLSSALRKQAESVHARHDLAVDVEIESEPELTAPAREALYRIAQEALNNAVKHAGAAKARITLRQLEDGLELVISDDGRGFDATAEFPGHLGLKSMSERAARLGGRVGISSAPGAGATVTAWLPTP